MTHNKFGKLKANIYFNIGMLIILSAVYTVINLYFSAKPMPFSLKLMISYIKSPMVFAVNFLPVLCFAILGFFVSNRVWAGCLTGGFVPLIFTLINFFKMKFRNDVFTMVDITLISEATNMGERYNYFPDITMWICFALIIASAFWCNKFCIYKFKAKKINIISSVAVIISAILCFEFIYLDENIYAKTENINQNSEFMNVVNKTDQYMCRGFVYSFLHSATNLVQKPPENYNANEAKAMLEQYSDDKITDDKKVNMICVMLEAYNDFSSFKNVKFKNNPYTEYRKIKEKSIHGKLFTNIFGGGTVDTERAFITGFSYMYDYRYPVDTYAKHLADNGYTVEGGHPGHNWFYSRDKINANFGFENYYFLENRYQELYDNTEHNTDDGILEDKYLFEDIISLYEQNKQTGKPYFNFSVTYQNHGPYETTELLADKIYVEKTAEMSDEAYNIVNNYFSGIAQTDKALAELVEWADAQQEPIMLVLFGDHNPWMGDGLIGYYEMGINVNTATPVGLYNFYQTPYVIYANDTAKKTIGNECVGNGGDFSPMFLMNKVYETNGWGGNRFMKISNEVRQYIDIITYTGLVRQNGEFTDYPDIKAYEALDKMRKVEYYMMDKK